MNNETHYLLTEKMLQRKNKSSGEFRPRPACLTGDGHAIMSVVPRYVTCPACIAVMAEEPEYMDVKRAELTTNQRLLAAGVQTIRTGETNAAGREIVLLNYHGVEIVRPAGAADIERIAKETWGLTI
jgi:hypothetical protein